MTAITISNTIPHSENKKKLYNLSGTLVNDPTTIFLVPERFNYEEIIGSEIINNMQNYNNIFRVPETDNFCEIVRKKLAHIEVYSISDKFSSPICKESCLAISSVNGRNLNDFKDYQKEIFPNDHIFEFPGIREFIGSKLKKYLTERIIHFTQRIEIIDSFLIDKIINKYGGFPETLGLINDIFKKNLQEYSSFGMKPDPVFIIRSALPDGYFDIDNEQQKRLIEILKRELKKILVEEGDYFHVCLFHYPNKNLFQEKNRYLATDSIGTKWDHGFDQINLNGMSVGKRHDINPERLGTIGKIIADLIRNSQKDFTYVDGETKMRNRIKIKCTPVGNPCHLENKCPRYEDFCTDSIFL